MAEIVGCFLLPHNPGITMVPTAAWSAGTPETIFSHFADIAERIRALRADTVIIIGSDHYTCFGPHCIPSCLIAIGDVESPAEKWLGFGHKTVANNEPLARHILSSGLCAGVDWSFAKSLTVDHSIAIPYQLVVAEIPDARVIPVYLNSGITPLLPSRRAFAIGASMRLAIDTWSGDERVVVLGTGGMSHWVGTDQMGCVNAEFDRHVMSLIEDGNVEALIALNDADVEQQAGNGALEIKNFICAMAMVPEWRGYTIGYEPMPELITGLGFMEIAA